VAIFLRFLEWLNQILTAWIAITAFALLLYALAFNLRDRVARTFAVILACVVGVFVSEAIASVTTDLAELEFFLRIQWIGIVFLPPSYLHFSDALLNTTGVGLHSLQRWRIRLAYLISIIFLATLPFSGVVGGLVADGEPVPHLQRTALTWVFTAYYATGMALSWFNFWRAARRTVTSTGRRRMAYLLAGALAPALGSYQYLLFGESFIAPHPLLFWLIAVLSNLFVVFLLVIMAYAVAFFGAPLPDRVVRRRLFKWLLRGPVTAVIVLAVTTLVRRAGDGLGFNMYNALVPISMVASLLITEYLITLFSPLWERVLIYRGGDRASIQAMQALQERVLTTNDLHHFLEAVLAAVCDRLQVSRAFVASWGSNGLEMVVSLPSGEIFPESALVQEIVQNGHDQPFFAWNTYWLAPLHGDMGADEVWLGLMGVERRPGHELDSEQREALLTLSHRAAQALEDRQIQQRLFHSLEALSPQVEMFQRLGAAARFEGGSILSQADSGLENEDVARWVKDALTHYWGGPRLTENPLLQLQVVQRASADHAGNAPNALRAILRKAIDKVRPEGERRFTGEWILYNILEMKFMEGYRVRDVAARLAMSEADLYRKQRVALEAVAAIVLDMEQNARQEPANKMENLLFTGEVRGETYNQRT